MRSVSRCVLALAMCAALSTPPNPAAAEVSAEGATALEQQLHTWLGDLLGPAIPIGNRPIRVQAANDHYQLEIPLAGMFGQSGMRIDGGALTGAARPLDGARWAVDNIRLPSPLNVTMPQPGAAGMVHWTLTSETQDQRMVLDPSLETESTIDSKLTGYESVMRLGGGAAGGTDRTRIEQMVTHSALRPAGDGKMTFIEQIEGSLMAVNSTAKEAGRVSMSIARLRGTLRADGVSPDSTRPIIRALADVSPLMMIAMRAANEQAGTGQQKHKDGKPQSGKPGKPPPDLRLSKSNRAALHAALVSMQSLASSFEEEGTLEDVRLQADTFTGHIDRISGSMGVTAPGGPMAVKMRFTMDGLDSPHLPEGVWRTYLPRHIAVAPRLSGLPGADAMALLLRALDSDGHDPDLDHDAEALLQSGTIAAGLDDLSLDCGPATLHGTGELRILARGRYAGEANVTATGLDSLIRAANTTAELKQAAPFLIFLKGIGQQDGDRVMWNIVYDGKQVLVNGTDVSEMMPE